jgi:hypothetical protein
MAMLLGKVGDPLDYLEVVSSGRPIIQSAAPCVAMASLGAGVTIRYSQATGQQLCQDRDHGAAGQARLRVSRRPAQDSDLMPEHQDLPVLAVSLRREHELAGYPDHQQLHKEDEHERQAYDPDRATVRILA